MLIYNSIFKKDIRMLLFYANYGFKTKPIYTMRDVKIVVEKIIIKVYELKKLYKQLSENIIFLKVKMA